MKSLTLLTGTLADSPPGTPAPRGGGHRHQVLGRVEGHPGVEVRVDRHHAARTHEQRVAVRRAAWPRSRRRCCRWRRRGSPPPPAGPALPATAGDGARDLVGGAARREVHDDPDRLGRGLGLGRPGRAQRERGRGQGARRGGRAGEAGSCGSPVESLRAQAPRSVLSCARPRGLRTKRIGSAFTGARRAMRHQCRVERLAGVVGQRRFARGAHGVALPPGRRPGPGGPARAAGCPCRARWSRRSP